MGGLQGDEALVVQKPYRDDELASKLEQALFPVRNLEGSQPSP